VTRTSGPAVAPGDPAAGPVDPRARPAAGPVAPGWTASPGHVAGVVASDFADDPPRSGIDRVRVVMIVSIALEDFSSGFVTNEVPPPLEPYIDIVV